MLTFLSWLKGVDKEFQGRGGTASWIGSEPSLLSLVMDRLTNEVKRKSPWTIIFADDIVICDESRAQVEEKVQRWRYAQEERGMKIIRSKTEYMSVNERNMSGTVKWQGLEVKKVEDLKYLG